MPPFPRRRVMLATLAPLLAMLLLLVEARRLRSLYWYDVRADYRYELSEAVTVPVALDATGFTLAKLPEGGHTALLRLDVSSSVLGHWFEPALEVRGPTGAGGVQFLERGARGRRYLNLGPLAVQLAKAGGRVQLRGRHLSWDEQQAELVVFVPPPLEEGATLIVAPHPDDAEIAAFGLYAETDSWIVTVSAGNYGDDRLAHLVSDSAVRNGLVGEVRAWDSVVIPLWGGVPLDRALNLGYFNGSLVSMYAAPDRPVHDPFLGSTDIRRFRRTGSSRILDDEEVAATWESLVDDLAMLLERVGPRIVVAPHPVLDASEDHKLTTEALFQAMARVGPGDRVLLLYTNHHAVSEYFPFGPAQGLVSLPPWTQGILRARGVYSHDLDETARLRKLFALEAHHDLRRPPRYASASPLGRVVGELGRTLTALYRDPVDGYSYLRRAPRPNELFLVFAEEDVSLIRAQAADFFDSLGAAKEDGG